MTWRLLQGHRASSAIPRVHDVSRRSCYGCAYAANEDWRQSLFLVTSVSVSWLCGFSVCSDLHAVYSLA